MRGRDQLQQVAMRLGRTAWRQVGGRPQLTGGSRAQTHPRLTASRAGVFRRCRSLLTQLASGLIHDNQTTYRLRRRAIARVPDSFGSGKHTGPMETSR